MSKTMIDPKKRPPKEENLKCPYCGHEIFDDKDVEYEFKSRCPCCSTGQMVSRWWGGWERTVREQREYHKYWRDLRAERQ